MRAFKDFSEIEEEVRLKTSHCPIVYKYRDWNEEYNKTIVTERALWFAHPYYLNDPQDCRPAFQYIIPDEINWDEIWMKIYKAGKEVEGDSISEEELLFRVNQRFEYCRSNMSGYLENSRKEMYEDSDLMARIGIFSLCCSYDNVPMWAYYGANHKGFAIGFDVVKLSKTVGTGFGFVEYSDEPIKYDISQDLLGQAASMMYRKKKAWENEAEYRFVSHNIQNESDRKIIYDPDVVSEIVLGYQFPDKDLASFIEAVKVQLPNVPIYKLTQTGGHKPFEKKLIVD